MKFIGTYLIGALAVLPLQTAPAVAVQVRVRGSFDDELCTNVSTVTIDEGGCNDDDDSFECEGYSPGGNLPYFGQGGCGDSRASVLDATFGESPYFMIEYYEDVDCQKLASSEVYLADGECHYFTLGSVRVWTAEDKSLAAVLQGSCERDEWWVLDKLNVSVNTGACIPQDDYETLAVKYVLVGDPPASSSVNPIAPPVNNKVSLYVGNDDAKCEKPSTVTITEGGCEEEDGDSECHVYQVGPSQSKMTYYGQGFCSDSRESYLKATFGGAPLFVIEYFDDNLCTNVVSSEVYLADGEPHFFTLGAMKVWISVDKSRVAVLTSADTSDESSWDVLDGMNVSVDPSDCVVESIYRMNSMRYVIMGDISPSSSSSSTSSASGSDTNTTNATTTTGKTSSASRVLVTSIAGLVMWVAISLVH